MGSDGASNGSDGQMIDMLFQISALSEMYFPAAARRLTRCSPGKRPGKINAVLLNLLDQEVVALAGAPCLTQQQPHHPQRRPPA